MGYRRVFIVSNDNQIGVNIMEYKKYYVGIKQVVYERALVEAESEDQARDKVNNNVEDFDWQVMDTSDFEICEVFDV